MKTINKLLAILVMQAMLGMQEAFATVSVTDFKNTSGAGTNKLDNVLNNLGQTGQSVLNFILIIFVVVGLLITGVSIYKFYQITKDGDRGGEKPILPVVGIIVGGALTVVSVIAGYAANTVTG